MNRLLALPANFLAASLLSLAMTGACAAAEPQDIVQWKAERAASLTSETGWLTLAGLYWLKPGANSFGSAAHNALQLEHAALAPDAGTFFLEDGVVRFVAGPTAHITHDGAPVAEIVLASDATDAPTILESGTLSFYLIDRVGNLGIRVRDSAHPLRTAFHGLDYFPYDDSWNVTARFEPYAPHKQVPIVPRHDGERAGIRRVGLHA
jgi:uncharacterized protein (DUF1684 family)